MDLKKPMEMGNSGSSHDNKKRLGNGGSSHNNKKRLGNGGSSHDNKKSRKAIPRVPAALSKGFPLLPNTRNNPLLVRDKMQGDLILGNTP